MTPVLCKNCRPMQHTTIQQITQTFNEEFYSFLLAHKTGHAIVIHLDAAQRLFPLVFNWLNLESLVCTISPSHGCNSQLYQILKERGILNLQNFWYFLCATWLDQIQIQYKNTDATKSSYLTHIRTANNNNLNNIDIITDLQRKIFWSTLSLALKITIQINIITNNFHTTTIINTTKGDTEFTKIINIRQSLTNSNSNLYEPWFSPTIIEHPPENKVNMIQLHKNTDNKPITIRYRTVNGSISEHYRFVIRLFCDIESDIISLNASSLMYHFNRSHFIARSVSP